MTVALIIVIIVLAIALIASKNATSALRLELEVQDETIDNLLDEASDFSARLLKKTEEYDILSKNYDKQIGDYQTTCNMLRARGDKYRDSLDAIIKLATPNLIATAKKMAQIAMTARL